RLPAIRGSAASAFRQQSVRRKYRTCPLHRGLFCRNWVQPACSTLSLRHFRLSAGVSDSPEKILDEAHILFAGRALDAGRYIDTGRLGLVQRLSDIVSIQSTGKHVIDIRVKRSQKFPVE